MEDLPVVNSVVINSVACLIISVSLVNSSFFCAFRLLPRKRSMGTINDLNFAITQYFEQIWCGKLKVKIRLFTYSFGFKGENLQKPGLATD